MINLKNVTDQSYAADIKAQANELLEKGRASAKRVLGVIEQRVA